MSTRSSIWLGQNQGKGVHIYWELAEREEGMRAPIYIAVHSEDADQETVLRLPKAIAIKLLIALSPNYADEVARII